MNSRPTPRHFRPILGNGHGFTTRSQYAGPALFAANHPRELPKPLNEKPSLTPRVLMMAIGLLIIITVVLALIVGFALFGQQWRSGATAPDEPFALSRPYQWANE